MLEQMYYEKADEIMEEHERTPKSLIPIMQDIQSVFRYLPAELLSYVAKELKINEAKAYSVATFYEKIFLLKKKENMSSGDGTACHVRKSSVILDALYKELGLSKKETYHETICCLP